MSVLKKAYARGIAETLLNAGLLKVASVEHAEKIADYVGERILFDPLQKVAQRHVVDVAQAILKVAEGTGSLITGDNPAQQNTLENAASQVGGLGALDQSTRPEGTYLVGVGNSEFAVPPGAVVGSEQPHPEAPGKTDAGTNSLIDHSKAASLSDIIKKIAGMKHAEGTGSLITGDNPAQQNTLENAASQVGGLGALDNMNRPTGTYLVGVGNSAFEVPPGAVVGSEQPHPEAPGKTDAGTNSLIDHSKSASYINLFEETAKSVVSKLPRSMNDAQKIASVKQMMGLNGAERQQYLSFLTKKAEEGGLPAFLADKAGDGKKDEDKKEDKSEDEKKDEKKEEAAEDFKSARAKTASTNNSVASLLQEIANIARIASK